MATVKKPGADKLDLDAPVEEVTSKDYGFHTTRSGVTYPVIDRYWSKKRRTVIDVYVKTRAVSASNPTTGVVEMQPDVKTEVHVASHDLDVQERAAERFGADFDRAKVEAYLRAIGQAAEEKPKSTDRVEL